MKTKGSILCYVLACFSYISATSHINIALIKDYLNYKRITTALFITCDSTNEILESLTELHTIDSYVNVLDIRNESVITALNYTQFFVRLEGSHTIIIDLDCEHINSILKQSSQRMLFHLERTWLIFTNGNHSFDLLNNQNINIDADVTLVIPLENRLIQITIISYLRRRD